ncbi:MAG TPA: hypothetical protein VM076_16470, partial [Gemmatimonadaceae bacterium]|nr:hypothetical protein [Gemmatimonadaceae bacterium]
MDASHPEQLVRFREATGKPMQLPTGAMALGSALAWTGIVCLASGGLTPPTWPAVATAAAPAYLPSSLEAMRRETDAVPATLNAASGARHLGTRPLVVLTATAKKSPAVLAAEGITEA